MLKIKNLCASVDGKSILKGIDLEINSGEVHAIMGPNGSGKSTLSYVLAGRDGYNIDGGDVSFQGQDLLAMSPEERSHNGLFLAFQYPVEIPGVQLTHFLKSALNAHRRAKGEKELDALDFLKLLKSSQKKLGISDEMLKRPLNSGASGGEKKRNEILQMSLIDPSLSILDETDSGLDIDALKVVSDGVNSLRSPDKSFLVITHYQRLLDYIMPDYVHVLSGGKIVRSGGPELAKELEEKGYSEYTGEAA
jgi:Fe-S cluster assembly ATP-binding protein